MLPRHGVDLWVLWYHMVQENCEERMSGSQK